MWKIKSNNLKLSDNSLEHKPVSRSVNKQQNEPYKLENLPNEVLLHIMSYVPMQHRYKHVALVSKQIYKMSTDPILLKHLAIRFDSLDDGLVNISKKAIHLTSFRIIFSLEDEWHVENYYPTMQEHRRTRNSQNQAFCNEQMDNLSRILSNIRDECNLESLTLDGTALDISFETFETYSEYPHLENYHGIFFSFLEDIPTLRSMHLLHVPWSYDQDKKSVVFHGISSVTMQRLENLYWEQPGFWCLWQLYHPYLSMCNLGRNCQYQCSVVYEHGINLKQLCIVGSDFCCHPEIIEKSNLHGLRSLTIANNRSFSRESLFAFLRKCKKLEKLKTFSNSNLSTNESEISEIYPNLQILQLE
jgi:hypothetical protein